MPTCDRVLLPNNTELIASSKLCKDQFFRIGYLAYGLQFRIESHEEMTEKWINEDKLFIKKALGAKGQEILREGNKEFWKKNLKKENVYK